MMQSPMLDNREVVKLRKIKQKTGIDPTLSKTIDYSLLLHAFVGFAKDEKEVKIAYLLIDMDELKSMHHISKKMDGNQRLDLMKESPKTEVDATEVYKEAFRK